MRIRRIKQLADPQKLDCLKFKFKILPGLQRAEFGVSIHREADYVDIRLQGHDPAGVLHAGYTVLEQLGYRFEISGPISPNGLNLDGLTDQDLLIRPIIPERGIRQHINFPMDISSYSLDEACEYLRNLARLRFNHITFHSYPTQWIRSPGAGETGLAGFFFYGQRHDLPDVPLLRRVIRNQKVYCIPEIEPAFDDWPQRSRLAVDWLWAVMHEARRVGLTVQFSFEPRGTGREPRDTLQQCAAILDDYPQIEILELITQETGGWGESQDPTILKDTISLHFGPSIVNHPDVAPLLNGSQPELARLVGELGHNLRAVKDLQDRLPVGDCQKVRLGVYCVRLDYLKACLALIGPAWNSQNFELALLPGHGSRQAAQNLQQMDLPAEQRQRTMAYNWLEFDGLMFVQQNAIPGIRSQLEQGSWGGVCFNHWRTAENCTTARYASQAALFGPSSEDEFYREEASRLEIAVPENYVEAMQLVAQADAEATVGLPNVGFCYVGVWGDEGLGALANWKADRLHAVRLLYTKASRLLLRCLKQTRYSPGLEHLNLLQNRISYSSLYLRAMETAVTLQPVIGDSRPDDLTSGQRLQVRRICNQALSLLRQAMRRYALLLPDRGCEGTLVSFYYTPMNVLRRIRWQYGGGPPDRYPVIYELVDAPPPPILTG